MAPRLHWFLALVVLCALVVGAPANAGTPPAPGDPPVKPPPGGVQASPTPPTGMPEVPAKPGVPEGSVSMGGPDQAFIGLLGQSGGIAAAVTKRDNNVYVGMGPRMVVFDVSNPAAPALIGRSVVLTSTIKWIQSAPGWAYALDARQLRIFDMSTPALPTLISSFPLSGEAYAGVYSPTLTSKWVWAACGSVGGVIALDVTNPTAIVRRGAYDSPGQALSLTRSGDYLFLADGTSGLRVVSIADPANPIAAGAAAAPPTESFLSVAVYGQYAYIGTSLGRFVVYDVSDPSHPSLRGSVYLPRRNWMWSIYIVSGVKAYVAADFGGLFALDITNPDAPINIGDADTAGRSRSVWVSNNIAYLADFYGLRIFDVTSPTPSQVGLYPAVGNGRAVSVVGNYAYVADVEFGTRVLSLSNLTTPLVIGSYNTVTTTKDVFAEGTNVYVAADYNGFHVLDVSTPSLPTRCGFITDPDMAAVGLWKQGDYVYIADMNGYLRVVDVTPCNTTAQVGITPAGAFNTAYAVVTSGQYAYVAAGSAGLAIVNIANPSNPTIVSTFPLTDTNEATALTISGSWVYVASATGGIYKVDVSNPSIPALSAYVETPGSPLDITIRGNYLFVADAGSGMHLYTAFTANLEDEGYWDTAGQANGIATATNSSGAYAFVADGTGGFYVLQVTGDIFSGRILLPVARRSP